MTASSQMPALVKGLLKPTAYPHLPQKVELVQTQMSYLFLTGEYAYKVKKPVNLGYLDYITIEQRRHFCEQEVVLNRRLSPEVYLGVVKIVREGGVFLAEREGEAAEYAVKMRQLPRDRMMDVLLAKNEVSRQMVRRVAGKMSDFHRQTETNPYISSFGGLDIIKRNNKENFDQAVKYIGLSISREHHARLQAWTERFIGNSEELFGRRLAEGRIRDCHGDLHSAHVCFTDSIVIYDCIEFNERFRYCDVASEIAFLAMDMDHKGQPGLARHFVGSYSKLAGDGELRKLLPFYKSYRACVRGKVESFKLDDPRIPEGDKKAALSASRRYFSLACRYAGIRPRLIIMAGLVGTGKSTVSEGLARRFGMEVVSSDVVRKRLAGIPATEHRFESFRGGIYSDSFSRRTYDEMFSEAGRVLDEGDSVILDASFRKDAERRQAKQIAESRGAELVLVECRLAEGLMKKRLAARLKGETVSDGRGEILEEQKRDFDRITGLAARNHLVVDTSKPIETVIRKVVERLLR